MLRTEPREIANPVIDTDFPDPALIKAQDGYFYVYATQSQRDGKFINLQVARSRDLANWEMLGDALPTKPSWASKTQNFWAPHVLEDGGTYYLYYSAQPDASLSDSSKGLCLAVATAKRPEGPFTDKGAPLLCGPSFVNIDPMAFDDPATGKHLLYWGSGFQPIRVRELAADRVSFAPGSAAVDVLQPDSSDDPGNYERLVEGAWVVRKGGWYYLFYSGDNCCGKDAHYAVLIARSRSATGPFEKQGSMPGGADPTIVQQNERWLAPGHNSVIEAAGASWMLYHAVDRRRPRAREEDDVNSRRVMLVERIDWVDGWPKLAAAARASR